MNIQFEQYDATNADHTFAAKQLANWSQQAGTMWPLSAKQMEDFAYNVVAFSGLTGNTLGHIAITEYDPEWLTIVGGYVVNPDYRGRGVGRTLINHMTKTARTVLPDIGRCAAKANRQSLSQFLAAGGQIVRINVEELGETQCGAYMVDMTRVLKPSQPQLNLLHLEQ